MRLSRLVVRCLAPGVLAVPMSGCTTLASGFGAQPPGINRYSFRECLGANGFFTDHALIGLPAANYRDRLTRRRSSKHGGTAIADLNDAAFAVSAAARIREGLFPHLQYADSLAREEAGYDAGIADEAHNRPYIVNAEGAASGTSGAMMAPPSMGLPPRPDVAINRYVDCYLAPLGRDEPGLSTTGDYDLEGRLLRAHLLLAMLMAFGTELVASVPGPHQAEQATRLLGHVRGAELSLRSASTNMNGELRRPAVLEGWAAVPPPDAAASGAPAAAIAQTKAADAAVLLDVPEDRAGAMPLLRWYG